MPSTRTVVKHLWQARSAPWIRYCTSIVADSPYMQKDARSEKHAHIIHTARECKCFTFDVCFQYVCSASICLLYRVRHLRFCLQTPLVKMYGYVYDYVYLQSEGGADKQLQKLVVCKRFAKYCKRTVNDSCVHG